MNSGIEELQEAINRLNSRIPNDGDYWPSGARMAGEQSDYIGDTFRDVNNSLSSGWESVSDFFMKIDQTVEKDVEYVYKAIAEYVEHTKENEKKEQKSLEEHEKSAEGILSELGL